MGVYWGVAQAQMLSPVLVKHARRTPDTINRMVSQAKVEE